MVGNNLKEVFADRDDIFYANRNDADLKDSFETRNLIGRYKPDVVVNLAAKVGGIQSNLASPYDYLYDNLMIGANVIEECRRNKVGQLISILSTCIYPNHHNNYPLKEEYLLDGIPPESNLGYAVAKRSMAVQADLCNKQYGTKYSYLIPCNLYGRHDKYDESNSHFVAALIKKIHEAKVKGEKKIQLWGDGTPLRQFMDAKDLALVIRFFIDNEITESCNVATDEVLTINYIAKIALFAIGCEHMEIEYINKRMNGQFRKDVDTSRLKSIMPEFKATSLYEGIIEAYKHYLTTI